MTFRHTVNGRTRRVRHQLRGQKVAVITREERCLGRAHARLLASRGAIVVINVHNVAVDGSPGNSNDNTAETVAVELRGSGASAVTNTDRIADTRSAARIVEQAEESFAASTSSSMTRAWVCATPYKRSLVLVRPQHEHHAARVPSSMSSGANFDSSRLDGSVLGSYSLAKAGVFVHTRQIGRYVEQVG